MNKSIWVFVILLLSLLLLMSILVQIFVRKYHMKSIDKLPEIEMHTLDSVLYNTKRLSQNLKPLVIIYFHPECEFCCFEIAELLKHQEGMNKTQLLFVTYASVEEIKIFIRKYPIDQFKEVIISLDFNGEFAHTFDVKYPPMIFIYDKNKTLIKKHKGLMPFERLEKYLKQSY